MGEILASPAAELVIWAAVLAALVAVGIYVIGKVREKNQEADRPASGLLTKFRELHSRGGLSDVEYRTIKSVLAEQIQDELNEKDEKG